MTQPKPESAKTFKKPSHWTNEPAPKPQKTENSEDLSPTRYGDWEKNGIAIDF